MPPKVSVIMPTYNNESTIHAAISSILDQSFSDFELIVNNDGSTDNTQKIIDSFLDSRLTVLKGNQNLGLPKRLNECLEIAKGDFIARMDADDISFPYRLEKQVSFLIKNIDVDLLGAGAVIFDNAKNIVGILPYFINHEDIVSKVWNNIPIAHPTWMARREWILKYKYKIPEVWRAEDQDLLLRAYKTSIYACLPDILLCYRQTKFDYKKTFFARINLFKSQWQYFLDNKNYKYMFLSICVFICKLLMDVATFLFGIRRQYSQIIDPSIKSMAQDIIEKS